MAAAVTGAHGSRRAVRDEVGEGRLAAVPDRLAAWPQRARHPRAARAGADA